MLRQRPKGKAAEICALLPKEVQAMGAVENLEGMIADYTDPEN